MLKKLKGIMSLIVVLCMVVLMFTACGGSENQSNESESKENSDANSSSVSEANAGETYEYAWLSIDAPVDEGLWGQKYLEDKFNIKIKIIRADTSRWDEQVSIILATGDIPDLIWCNSIKDVGNYAKQGILAEVKMDSIEKNMPNYYKMVNENDPQLFSYSVIDGKNMGLAKLNANGQYPYPGAIRADWLKNVGITKPPETLQELEDIFLKFRNNDPDKNGKQDTYAISMPSDTPTPALWFQTVFGAYGANPFFWRENNGKVEFGLVTPEVREALKLLQKWYKSEIIDPEFITEKGRISQKDISYKFSTAKLGYMDNLRFEDYQWDNDGHLNAKWIANNPAWAEFFEKYKADTKTLYATKNFTTFDDSVPQPIYINIPPVKGPDGKSGYYTDGFQNQYLAFGKQIEKDQKKFDKLLQVLEVLATDEQTYIETNFGPEGKAWITDDKGIRQWNPNWSKDPDYHPQGLKLAAGQWANPIFWTNPNFNTVIGGERAEQRYDRCGAIVAEYPSYQSALKSVLPSSAETNEITNTFVKDFVIKCIASNVDIDKEFDSMVSSWMAKGGEKLTKEANDWYQSIKK